MAHGSAEVIMPIGTMETVAKSFGDFIVVEKYNIGNIRKIVIGTQLFVATGHFLRTNFSPNGKGTGGGSVTFAGGDSVGGDLLITVEDVYLLISQIDLNSAIGVGG